MKLSVVVVWFNPDEKCIENLSTYYSYVERIYVVDNSEADNSGMLAGISDAVYIPNFENKGIAAALNQGCERALSDGFDWCMTMDQDSSWEKDALERYLALVKENSNDSMNVSFAPTARILASPRSVCGDIKHFLLKVAGKIKTSGADCLVCGAVSCDRVITSGNIISLLAWDKASHFYEPFFIDEVDFEFCYRLKENGFSIIKFPQVQMNHILGIPKKTFFQCDLNHHKKRLYYIFRNSLCLKNMHHEYFKKLNYKKHLAKIWLDIFLTAHLMDFFYVVQGIRDALRNHMGKYEHWHKQCLRNK